MGIFFFRYLFVLIYFDGSRRNTHATTHSTRTQIVRAKMTSLDGFFAGKQVELTFVYRSRSVTLVKEFEVDL